MIVLIGESASGKSSVERYLVDTYKLKKIISYTTRSPRSNEVDGADYHFINKHKFLQLWNDGFFAEMATYNGWYYGSAKEDYTNDKIAVLTPHGLRQLKRLNDINITSFYIKVPRRDRLIKILQRGDNIEEAYRRSLSDIGQFDGVEDEVDHVVINNSYLKSVEEISKEIIANVSNITKLYQPKVALHE